MSAYQPELGQLCFGNPWNGTALRAMFFAIWAEIERVYQNVNQVPWEGDDPKIPGIAVRPYWWGDCDCAEDEPHAVDCPVCLPNFAFGEVEIRWYKHPGRGMSTNVDWDANRWAVWMRECLAAVGAFEAAVER